MSLFGTTPPSDPFAESSPRLNNNRSRHSPFDDDIETGMQKSSNIFKEDDDDLDVLSPWDSPTPRKQRSQLDMLRNVLPSPGVQEYDDIWHALLDKYGNGHEITSEGVARTLACARLRNQQHAEIAKLVTPLDNSRSEEVSLARSEFNVLLALIGLAQENESLSLDSVDERRKNLPVPNLPGLLDDVSSSLTKKSRADELAVKPPQRPRSTSQASNPPPAQPSQHVSQTRRKHPRTLSKASMDESEDPWRGQRHQQPVGSRTENGTCGSNQDTARDSAPRSSPTVPSHDSHTFGYGPRHEGGSFAAEPEPNCGNGIGGWGEFHREPHSLDRGFTDHASADPVTGSFGDRGASARDATHRHQSRPSVPRTAIGGRSSAAIQETITVTLRPEKEGMFLLKHHNYEITSQRKGNKVIRRYSDFVWLLDCLHKRYPFRALPMLPPKRVALNGTYLTDDGAFVEKRRRGLARFLNALVRHPMLGVEQLVVMFLTVPTELAVWRKQATISVQDEFTGRVLPAQAEEDILPPRLDDLFDRSRAGIRRSATLYINLCNIMDRLVKHHESVATGHARVAIALMSLTEVSSETYAIDKDNVPPLNDGLTGMCRRLRTAQSLIEDEAKAWDEGVLEDFKKQRDALIAVRDMFDRRDRLDKSNIPELERRIQTNEAKLVSIRSKPEVLVKPGEAEKIAEAIVKDKESIVEQHNRSIFIKECISQELKHFQSTQYNISRWNQDWAQERVKYAEMQADNWRRALGELENMPLGD